MAIVLFACSLCYADTISVTALPDSISVTGSLSNPNDVIQYSFAVTNASDVSFQTYSYGGGTNAAGQTISGGGFMIQELALFGPASAGSQLLSEFSQGTDLGCPAANTDAYGYCGDIAGTTHLAAGTYTVALMAFGDFPNGSSLPTGFTNTGNFVTNGDTLTPNFAFDITGDPSPVPEPATLALFGSGLLLAARKLRKRAGFGRAQGAQQAAR